MGPSIEDVGKFHDFWPLPPSVGSFFTTIHWQIWQILDPSPLKNANVLNGWSLFACFIKQNYILLSYKITRNALSLNCPFGPKTAQNLLKCHIIKMAHPMTYVYAITLVLCSDWQKGLAVLTHFLKAWQKWMVNFTYFASKNKHLLHRKQGFGLVKVYWARMVNRHGK